MLWFVSLAFAGPVEIALLEAVPLDLHDDVRGQVVPHGGAANAAGYGSRGASVLLTREIEGLPVDVSGAVWLRSDGSVRAKRDFPELDVLQGAALPVAEAKSIAATVIAGVPAHARLSWQPVAGSLRKVWTVMYARSIDPRFEAPIVRLDAANGGVLSVEEGAIELEAVADIYATNPVVEPEPVEVSFTLPDVALSDERVDLRQCADLEELFEFEFDKKDWAYHICSEVPATVAADGDYRLTSVPYPEDPARDEDDFVAANLYWHVSLGLDWFTDLGWVPLPDFDPALQVMANSRNTDTLSEAIASDPTGPLLPYNNAYSAGGYFDWEKVWVPPRLVFGQGTEIDYGYDADVIYHELAHFIVRSQDGPSFTRSGSFGPSVDGGSLNEGLADYFSSAILGEGVLGEYSAGTEREYIRTLDGDTTCHGDLYGEVHYDSQPFAQGLWWFRGTLSVEDMRLLDEVVLDSLTVMGRNVTFAKSYEVLTDAVDEVLGAAAGDRLREEWQRRGLPACEPVLWVEPSADEPVRSYQRIPWFSEYSHDNMVPGYLQMVLDVPAAGDLVTIRATQLEFLGIDLYGTNAPVGMLVVGGPGERITWDTESTYTLTPYYYAVLSLERWVHDAAVLGTLVQVASRPHDDVPERYMVHDFELTITAAEAGPMVFQFANAASGYAPTLYDVGFVVEPAPEPTEPDPTEPTEPTEPDTTGSTTDRPLAKAGSEEKARGCGCDGGAGWAGWWLVLPMASLLRRRSDQAG